MCTAQQYYKKPSNLFICPLCQGKTKLDPYTVKTLMNINEKVFDNKIQNMQIIEEEDFNDN